MSAELTIVSLINIILFFALVFKCIIQNVQTKYFTVQLSVVASVAVVFIQYLIAFVIENVNTTPMVAQHLRYIDSLVSLPLLLFSYWKLANVDGYTGDFALMCILTIGMVIFQLIAEYFSTAGPQLSLLFYLFSLLCYIYILIRVINIMNFYKNQGATAKYNLGWFFVIGWLAYIFGYFLHPNFKYVVYSIIDFVVKGLYSITITNIVQG